MKLLDRRAVRSPSMARDLRIVAVILLVNGGLAALLAFAHMRGLVAYPAILRDPIEMVAKSAVVELVDKIAMDASDATGFRQRSAGLLSETDDLPTVSNRQFVRRRVHDWLFYLSALSVPARKTSS